MVFLRTWFRGGRLIDPSVVNGVLVPAGGTVYLYAGFTGMTYCDLERTLADPMLEVK
jgi:hypothetical protein